MLATQNFITGFGMNCRLVTLDSACINDVIKIDIELMSVIVTLERKFTTLIEGSSMDNSLKTLKESIENSTNRGSLKI